MANLRRQAISSVKWTTLRSTVVAITGPFLLIIKARFLSPKEFGYIAVILIFLGLFQLLESFGFSQAIIQKDEVSIHESSSLFYFNILLSFFLAVLLYIISPLIATFFSLPNLKEYLRVICIIVLVTSPSLFFRAFLEKQMYFKHISLIEIAKNFVILGTTTLFLVLGWGILGIIYAQILGSILVTVAILVVTFHYKTVAVSLYFNPAKLIPFFRFGLFISAKQFMTFASHRLDEVVIGYFLEPEILGIYHFGKNMLERIRNLMTMSFGKVLFPVLAKIKHHTQKLTFTYHRISRYIAFGSFPVFAGIAATAHLFVPVLFGEQWIKSIIVFQVFSVAVILLILTANVSSSLLYAVNKPDIVFYIDVVTNVLYFITLFLFAPQGMNAVLIVYSCYVIYKTLALQYYANRQLADSFLSYFRELTVPFGLALIMVIAVLIFQLMSDPVLKDVGKFAGSIIIGILVYTIMACLFAKETLSQLKLALIKGDIPE